MNGRRGGPDLQFRDLKYVIESQYECILASSASVESESGFSFLQTLEKPNEESIPWTTRCCRSYSPIRMAIIGLLILIATATVIILGFIVQNEITERAKIKIRFTPPPGIPNTTDLDLLIFSLPNSCRVISILGVIAVIMCYVLKPTFRFNSMPLIIPMLLSQLGFLTSNFYISVAPFIYLMTTNHHESAGTPHPTTTNRLPSFMASKSTYCGVPSSILTTTFNLCQIAFTTAVTYRLLQSVGSPIESLCDTKHMDRRMNRWILFIIFVSLSFAAAISLASIPQDKDGGCQYNPISCMSEETQLVNNMIAPAIGLATVTVLYFRIKTKVHNLYPTNARRVIKSVASYHIMVYAVTWGISLFLFSLLTVLKRLPTQVTTTGTSLFRMSIKQQEEMQEKLQNMLLIFVPYDLQGFLTSVVAIWSYFRLRSRFDLGLSLKAINPASIEFDEPLTILGQGTFAVVVKAMWYPSRQVDGCLPCFQMRDADDKGLRVAVKTFKLERNAYSNLNGIQEEAYLASKLVHPHIMATYGCYTVGSTLYLVCEYLGGGTLQDVIDGTSVLPYEQVLLYALQIASGMEFLHGLTVPVIHRDLKPLNCCFDQSQSVLKLVDFGLSRLFRADPSKERAEKESDLTTTRSGLPFLSSATTRFSQAHEDASDECVSLLMTSRVGTVCWAAPEVLAEEEQTRYSLKVDVYSFGIICWQLYTGKQPFSDIPGSVLAVEEAVLQGTRPKIPDDCPIHFAKLMRRSWHARPERRPSFHDIVRVLHAELAQFHMYGTERMEPRSPCELD